MAVNKICTSHAGTQGAMKNCISYVLRDAKVHDGYCAITGPYPYDEINLNNVYRAFVDEKKIWGKTGGREYMHSIISFHKDEKITYAQALQFGKDLAENDTFYKDFQTLIAVHQDTEHIHIHFVTNSVSFIDGHKEHHSQKDTLSFMNRTNLNYMDDISNYYGLALILKIYNNYVLIFSSGHLLLYLINYQFLTIYVNECKVSKILYPYKKEKSVKLLIPRLYFII